MCILTCPFEPPKPKTKHKLDITSKEVLSCFPLQLSIVTYTLDLCTAFCRPTSVCTSRSRSISRRWWSSARHLAPTSSSARYRSATDHLLCNPSDLLSCIVCSGVLMTRPTICCCRTSCPRCAGWVAWSSNSSPLPPEVVSCRASPNFHLKSWYVTLRLLC